jgi:hypothetical protein
MLSSPSAKAGMAMAVKAMPTIAYLKRPVIPLLPCAFDVSRPRSSNFSAAPAAETPSLRLFDDTRPDAAASGEFG